MYICLQQKQLIIETPQNNIEKLSVKEGTAIALNKKEHIPFKKGRDVLKKAIKKAIQCRECGAILALREYPGTCDNCQKNKFVNFKTLPFKIFMFRQIADLDIKDIYDLEFPERFNLKEIIRGLTNQKPVLPFKFENVINKKELTEDHINGCTTIANQVVIKIKNGDLNTDKEISDFIWEKSGKVKTTKEQNVNGLKEFQNNSENGFISPEQYISVVGRIQKNNSTFYTEKESAEILKPYFL